MSHTELNVCERKWAPRICCDQPSNRPVANPSKAAASALRGWCGSHNRHKADNHKPLVACPAGKQCPTMTGVCRSNVENHGNAPP